MKKGTHHTEEAKRKMSENHWDNSGANNPNFGKQWTEERRKKSSATKMGHAVSAETREKLSKANKGKIISEYQRQRISEANKGRVKTEEERQKMKASYKGQLHTEEARKKARETMLKNESNVGKVRSEETRRHLSEVHTGKVMSEETKEKIRIANLKSNREQRPIYQYDLEGNFIAEYSSLGDIKRQLGYDTGVISKCCNGKRKTSYGFIWKKE